MLASHHGPPVLFDCDPGAGARRGCAAARRAGRAAGRRGGGARVSDPRAVRAGGLDALHVRPVGLVSDPVRRLRYETRDGDGRGAQPVVGGRAAQVRGAPARPVHRQQRRPERGCRRHPGAIPGEPRGRQLPDLRDEVRQAASQDPDIVFLADRPLAHVYAQAFRDRNADHEALVAAERAAAVADHKPYAYPRPGGCPEIHEVGELPREVYENLSALGVTYRWSGSAVNAGPVLRD
jgi:hypothetical protein